MAVCHPQHAAQGFLNGTGRMGTDDAIQHYCSIPEHSETLTLEGRTDDLRFIRFKGLRFRWGVGTKATGVFPEAEHGVLCEGVPSTSASVICLPQRRGSLLSKAPTLSSRMTPQVFHLTYLENI